MKTSVVISMGKGIEFRRRQGESEPSAHFSEPDQDSPGGALAPPTQYTPEGPAP